MSSFLDNLSNEELYLLSEDMLLLIDRIKTLISKSKLSDKEKLIVIMDLIKEERL